MDATGGTPDEVHVDFFVDDDLAGDGDLVV